VPPGRRDREHHLCRYEQDLSRGVNEAARVGGNDGLFGVGRAAVVVPGAHMGLTK
jgi:hypothetical protein